MEFGGQCNVYWHYRLVGGFPSHSHAHTVRTHQRLVKRNLIKKRNSVLTRTLCYAHITRTLHVNNKAMTKTIPKAPPKKRVKKAVNLTLDTSVIALVNELAEQRAQGTMRAPSLSNEIELLVMERAKKLGLVDDNGNPTKKAA